MMLQGLPPPPPTIDPNLILMHDNGPSALLVIAVVVAGLAAAVIILWPLMKAFARRVEGKGSTEPGLRAEVEQLQARLSEVDNLHSRMAELEERVDFTERLLAQVHDPQARVLRGETQ